MGRIHNPALQTLADQWSDVITELLDRLGEQTWPPRKIRRGLLKKPEIVKRHLVEGPAQRGQGLVWALSHTSRPSSFDEEGNLSQGERHYWLLYLEVDSPPIFRIEGAGNVDDVPASRQNLERALEAARQQGPKIELFYGNKGPLSHR